TGAAQALVPNDALVIENVERRPALDVPLGRDGALRSGAVKPRAPGHFLILNDLLELIFALIAVDAQEDEGLAFHLLHERPLVRVHGPAGPSPVPPEIEQHHLAAIIGQLELLAVEVLALDVGCRLADRQEAQLEQLALGPFADRAAERQLD